MPVAHAAPFMAPAWLTVVALAQAPQAVEIDANAPVHERSVALAVSLNLGAISVEWQHGSVMGFASGSAPLSVLYTAAGSEKNSIGAVALGLGFTKALSHPSPSMWFLDVFVEAVPGWNQQWDFARYLYLGLGAGLGVRFLHASGFTFGIKLPVLGAAIGDVQQFGPGTGQLTASTGLFYLSNLMALPMVSLGYRFNVH
jgi:hypothetical protein